MACSGKCQQSMGTPPDFGFPNKFQNWRPNQEEAIIRALDSQQRVVAQVMPTGSGKSLTYMFEAVASGGRVAILSSTKGLQDQLMQDFASVGLVDIRGKQNYECQGFPGMTCEEGSTARCHLRGGAGCPSQRAKMRALSSRLVLTNYSYWIATHKYGTGLGQFDMLVMDEGHNAPEELAQAMQVAVSYHEVEEMLESTMPKDRVSLQEWKTWAFKTLPKVREKRDTMKARIQQTAAPKPSWIKTYNHLCNMVRKYMVVAQLHVQDWVVDSKDWGYQFDPIRPARYGESTLFLGIPKIIVTSATIRPKTLQLMGLNKFDFQEYDSAFDPKRFPIYRVPTVRVDHRMDPASLRMLMIRMDQAIGRRLDRKGLIHTVSHRRRDDVLELSGNSRYMMSNYEGDITTKVVEAFKRSPAPRLLVSASLGTGYDFPYQDAEYQVVLKVPFPDGRSKVTKARQEADKEYGPYLTAQELAQMCGRIGRAADDQGETIILDDHAEWFVWKFRHLLPASFKRFYRQVASLPAPLPKLER